MPRILPGLSPPRCALSATAGVPPGDRIGAELLGMGIAPACLANLRRYGHLGPNDVLLNLYHAIALNQLPDGGVSSC